MWLLWSYCCHTKPNLNKETWPRAQGGGNCKVWVSRAPAGLTPTWSQVSLYLNLHEPKYFLLLKSVWVDFLPLANEITLTDITFVSPSFIEQICAKPSLEGELNWDKKQYSLMFWSYGLRTKCPWTSPVLSLGFDFFLLSDTFVSLYMD